MIDHLCVVNNFIIESINNPDEIIDDIHIVTEDYKMDISNKISNGYMVTYKTHREITTLSMASKLYNAYNRNTLRISNKVTHRPENLIILGASGVSPIIYKDCVFLRHTGFESISICEDCIFVGWRI